MNKKISIILLNYNGFDDTIECFESLQKITYSNYNIVIVDNNSPDKSMDRISNYMKEKEINFTYQNYSDGLNQNNSFMNLIQSGSNGGYGHGNNIGIKYALSNNSDYILLLNNDTLVDKNFLAPLIKYFEDHENIGILASQIFYEDRPTIFWANGGSFNKITGKIRHININEKENGQINSSNCTFLSGCMWFIPKKIFTEVGYINEDYFMYVEDLEFCQRVISAGYKLRVISESKIWHKVGSSSGGELTKFSVYWRTKNYLKFMKDHIEIYYWPIHIFTNFFIFSINIIRNKKIILIKNQLQGIKDFFKEINKGTL